MEKTMRMVMSKYALTKGLYEIDVQKDPASKYVHEAFDWHFTSLKIGKDVHYTWEEAIEEGYRKKEAKIASLKKQLTRLMELEIKPKER